MDSGYARRGSRSLHLGRYRGTLAVAAIAAVALVAACGSSSSTSPSAAGSSSSYFKGKTITLIAPDSPGGSYDLYARLFAPYVGQELRATINVENIAVAGTVGGSNQMAAANPNGLTIGMVNVGADTAGLVEQQPGQNFDMARLSWIGQPAEVPNALVVQPGGAVQSFSALLHSSSTLSVLDIRNGIGDMLNRVVLGAFGIPKKLDTGFESTSSLKQGFLAKDGEAVFEAISTLYPLISGKEAKPLLYIGSLSLPSYEAALKGVPNLQAELSAVTLSSSKADAVKEAVALSNLSDDFAAPAGLSASELAALRQAFAKAASLSALRAQAAKESLPISFISGADLAGQVATALANDKLIAPYVN